MSELPVMKGHLPIPGMSEAEDEMRGMIVAMASELSVLRERVDTLETVLAGSGVIAQDAVDSFEPGPADLERRGAFRRRLISKIFRPVLDAARRQAEHSQQEQA